MKGLNSYVSFEYLIVPAPFVKKIACVFVDSAFITFAPLKKEEVGRAQRIDV